MSASATSALSPSSSLRKSAPVRAIMSPLSTRSAPPIPSSADLFDPLVKAVLRHRLVYHILAYSLLFSWIQNAAWAIWSARNAVWPGFTGYLATLVWPTTLLWTFLQWAVVPLPVIILRKRYLTVVRTTASSPSIQFRSALSSKTIAPVFMSYTISAFLVALLYATGMQLSIFIRSNHSYHLSGRFVFLLSTQLAVFYGFQLRDISLDRFTYSWSKVSSSVSRWPFHTHDLVHASAITLLFTSICYAFSMAAFALARAVLSLMMAIPLVSPILAPLTGRLIRGPWTIFLPFLHIPLLFKSFLLSLMTLSALEFADILFHAFVTQPISVARKTSNPSLTAVSGMSSSDVFIKYLAYSELCYIATDQSPRGVAERTALFGDTKHIPTLWSQLVREALLFLGQDYQAVLRRGQAPTPAPKPAPTAATQTKPPPPPGTPTHLIKKSIYKTTTTTTTAPNNTSVQTVGDALAAEANAGAIAIRDMYRSFQSAVVSRVWVGAVSSLKRRWNDVVAGLFQRHVPLWAREALEDSSKWWRRERIHKTVEASLPRKEIDKLAIRALSHLVCASLAEDQYGVVQRDIPQILEALSSFLYVVEQYRLDIGARHAPPTTDATASPEEVLERERVRLELEKAQEHLTDITDALKEAVTRVVRTFGSKLLAFKFPVRTAERLQAFLDNS